MKAIIIYDKSNGQPFMYSTGMQESDYTPESVGYLVFEGEDYVPEFDAHTPIELIDLETLKPIFASKQPTPQEQIEALENELLEARGII